MATDDDALADGLEPALARPRRGLTFAEPATNSRLSELEAAALRIGLRRLEDGNRRAEIAFLGHGAAPGLRWHPEHP